MEAGVIEWTEKVDGSHSDKKGNVMAVEFEEVVVRVDYDFVERSNHSAVA